MFVNLRSKSLQLGPGVVNAACGCVFLIMSMFADLTHAYIPLSL